MTKKTLNQNSIYVRKLVDNIETGFIFSDKPINRFGFTKKKEHIYHAALLDPLTAANLTIDEIYSMTDKLIEAHYDYLPKYI